MKKMTIMKHRIRNGIHDCMMGRTFFFLLMTVSCLFVTPALNARQYTEEHPLIIAGDWEYPPYEYLDEDGKWQGFNMEILQAVLNKMNIPFRVELKEWADVLKTILNGKADLACAMHTYDQEEHYYFSKHPFCINSLCLVYRDGVKPIQALNEMKPGRVCIKNKDIAYNVILDSGYIDRVDTVADIKNILKDMSKGRHDMAIWGRLPLNHLIYKYKFRNLKISDLNLPSMQYHFISKDSVLLSKVDSTFVTMKAKGQLDDIYTKWFSDLPAERTTIIPVYVYYIVGILLVILGLLYVFVAVLRYKVKKANKTILQKNKRIALALHVGCVYIMEYNIRKREFCGVEGDDSHHNVFSYDLCRQTIQHEDFVKFDDIIQRMSNGWTDDESLVIRVRITGQDDWRYIEVTFTTLREEDDIHTTLLCTFKDITENIKKQREEKQLLEKYAVVFNSTSVGLIYYDKDGTLVDINSTACKILKANREELLSTENSLYDNEYLSKCVTKQGDVPFYGTIRINNVEFRKFHPSFHLDSDLFLETQVSSLYDDANCLQSIIVTIIDVTELHLANRIVNESIDRIQRAKNEIESYARKINYALRVGRYEIWNYDLPTKKITFSSDIKRSEATVTQEDCIRWISEEDKKKLSDAFMMMDSRQADTFSTRFKYDKYPDRKGDIYMSYNGIPVKDKKDNITGYFGLMKDVTDFISLQNKLKEESKRAQESDRLKSVFLANMSHEIRTPLNAIVGFSNLLESANDASEKSEFIKIINHNSEQLLRLINDILDLSRLDADIIKLVPEDIDFAIVFSQTFETLKQRISIPGVEFIAEMPYKSCQTCIDYTRISQVITNFVINASKYTKKGHIRVGYEKKDGGLRIYCEDTGCGIPRDKCNEVFDRFVKLNEFIPGTGLGLSICKAIVDHCHGTIGVDSEEGVGSTFWMWIPCKVEVTV